MYPVDSQTLRQSAFEPLKTDTGTPYPCLQQDLDSHSLDLPPNLNEPVSLVVATEEIEYHNSAIRPHSIPEIHSIENLQKGIINAAQKPWGLDIIIKMFADIDRVFFMGVLKGNVRVRWEDRQNFVDEGFDADRIPRFTTVSSPRHRDICLHLDQIDAGSNFSETFDRVWNSMLIGLCVKS